MRDLMSHPVPGGTQDVTPDEEHWAKWATLATSCIPTWYMILIINKYVGDSQIVLGRIRLLKSFLLNR